MLKELLMNRGYKLVEKSELESRVKNFDELNSSGELYVLIRDYRYQENKEAKVVRCASIFTISKNDVLVDSLVGFMDSKRLKGKLEFMAFLKGVAAHRELFALVDELDYRRSNSQETKNLLVAACPTILVEDFNYGKNNISEGQESSTNTNRRSC